MENKCTWCGEIGDENSMIFVEGYHVPAEHTGCRNEILKGKELECECDGVDGSNVECPVHGVQS